jgi:hypothetical protein
MTPIEVQVDIAEGAADPAQLAAWQWLWTRLLREPTPQKSNAPGPTPEASSDGTARRPYRENLHEPSQCTL